MHFPRPSLRRLLLSLTLATPFAFAPTAWAQFLRTDAGPYDFNDAANWNGGTINNQLTSNLAADQTVSFGANTTLSSGLTINNTSLFNHTFLGSGGDRTLTLGGNISLGSSVTNPNTVTIGSASAGSRLNLDLGGSSRTIAVGTNRTLDILDVLSGTGGFIKTGAGTLKLTNTANTSTGSISIGASGQFGGVLEVTKLADSGTASSIGSGSSITFGGANGAATLRYVGSGDTSNRTFTIGSQGAIFESSGTGAMQFTNTGNIDVSPSNTVSRTITFTGSNTGDNTFTGVIRDPSASARTSIAKTGAGTWILAGNNTNTGDITVTEGILAISAANRLADTSSLVMAGGTFATGGFSETLGTLSLTATSIIDLGSGDSDLIFADSSAAAWGSSVTLSFINFTAELDSIRIGNNGNGLTLAQLGQIRINGSATTIDGAGFLAIASASAVPEPASFAMLAGLGCLLLATTRRRRAA